MSRPIRRALLVAAIAGTIAGSPSVAGAGGSRPGTIVPDPPEQASAGTTVSISGTCPSAPTPWTEAFVRLYVRVPPGPGPYSVSATAPVDLVEQAFEVTIEVPTDAPNGPYGIDGLCTADDTANSITPEPVPYRIVGGVDPTTTTLPTTTAPPATTTPGTSAPTTAAPGGAVLARTGSDPGPVAAGVIAFTAGALAVLARRRLRSRAT